ncbi:MAG: PAS domain-containing protein [Kiritimatiellae bacterium]|nr:PAS domain-containing protein [Kiritimatiellia bacterium]
MKFWFGKKDSADRPDAEKAEATEVVDAASPLDGGGAVDACLKTKSVGSGMGEEGALSLDTAVPGMEKICVPEKTGVAPSGLEGVAKAVEVPQPQDEKGTVAETGNEKAAVRAPILKAVPASGSGVAQLRPIISIKPKAQGAGLAALAAARKAALGGKAAVAVGTDGVPEKEPKIDSAGSLAKESDPDPEKGKAVTESDGVPVRAKPDQRVLYYQLMNGLYDAILILDDKGFVVDCNSRFSDLLGYAREDSWDMPIGKIITGMSSQMLGHLKSNLMENHHIMLDARCLRKDGTSFTAEVGVSIFSLTRGDNMVFMIRNVERRKKAMDELRKGNAALEIALVPAFVCDTDGFFVVVNNAFLESFSIPDLEHAKAVRLVELLPDAGRVFLRAACGEKIREKLQIAMPDATGLTLDVALAPVQSGQTITGVAGSIMQA